MTSEPKIVPAQLAFLAIYNPSLGTTDETFRDQVVYWYSRAARTRARRKHAADAAEEELARQDLAEENEKLRQIGLAQGMVGFAKSFANGQPVDSIDTEKSRIILHELETGWWILASVDLTRIPVPVEQSSTKKDAGASKKGVDPDYEYSSREVSPAALLLRNITVGHRIFLLHNGSSLSSLYTKLNRQKFCGLLERFWNRFAQSWDVLLHGNPAVDIFSGLKLAAGGELGIGVGEEEWGSGEREVLEDFARRTDGLVDLTVSRFGEPSKAQTTSGKKSLFGLKTAPGLGSTDIWMGAGNHSQVGDGIVFSGTGAVSRSSLRDISHWTQEIYAYGEAAYGVGIHPSNDRRKRKRRQPEMTENGHASKSPAKPSAPVTSKVSTPPGIPPPIVSAVERSLERATSSHDVKKAAKESKGKKPADAAESESAWTKYLTLGYGTAWGPSASSHAFQRQDSLASEADEHGSDMRHVDAEPYTDPEVEMEERLKKQVRLEDHGHFLIGLKGELSEEDELASDDDEEDWNERTLIRTLHVEVVKGDDPEATTPSALESRDTSSEAPEKLKLSRLRVMVYVHRPFIYTFLFRPQTESLSLPVFYRDIHTFFAPLHKPLSISTSPERVAARIALASQADVPSTNASINTRDASQQPIFDLVYDPLNLAVHASIPNIPMPGSLAAEGLSLAPGGSIIPEGWTRSEGLNVHSAILEVVRSTRHMPGIVGESGDSELERSVKTGRGWWVVWMRLDDGSQSDTKDDVTSERTVTSRPTTKSSLETGKDYFAADMPPAIPSDVHDDKPILANSREAILVRRARDALSSGKAKAGGASGIWSFGLTSGDSSGKDAGSGWGPARLAEGVGIDARKYVEGLLSLNR